ncbi:MAG: sugar ABC transporter permease [Firmicutes bacterium]|nr:sugar ABC transporter permease [Bacillota bacterium]
MSRRTLGYLLVLPAGLVIGAVLIYPIVYSAYISFFEMFIGPGTLHLIPVGFKNYIDTIRSPQWWGAFARTAYFVLYDILVGMSLGLGIAILLNREFRLRGVARALILFPYVLPSIVRALMWKWISNSDYGFLNGLLFQLGLIDNYIPWLSDPRLAIHMLILINIWEGTPFAILMYLAALQTIPKELYEASEVDGATSFQMFTKITFPLILPTTFLLVVMKTIATFKVFDLVYALTGGGPGESTQVISHLIYTTTFGSLQFGKGAAMSYILLFIILLLVILYSKLFGGEAGW